MQTDRHSRHCSIAAGGQAVPEQRVTGNAVVMPNSSFDPHWLRGPFTCVLSLDAFLRLVTLAALSCAKESPETIPIESKIAATIDKFFFISILTFLGEFSPATTAIIRFGHTNMNGQMQLS